MDKLCHEVRDMNARCCMHFNRMTHGAAERRNIPKGWKYHVVAPHFEKTMCIFANDGNSMHLLADCALMHIIGGTAVPPIVHFHEFDGFRDAFARR